MGNCTAKDKVKEYMMLDPTLKELFEWKEGLGPTDAEDGFNIAVKEIKQGNLERAKFFILTEFSTHEDPLRFAILRGDTGTVKNLIESILNQYCST